MTISTTPYYEWNNRNDSTVAPFNSCSPNLLALESYYRRRWGSTNLGCHVQRVISGSSALSSHAWGAATDDRFPSRAKTIEAMAFLIANSAELGINTIHDYALQRKWDPIVGWHSASIGSVGGDWIHVETTPAMFLDGRPVEDKLIGSETDVALTGEDAKLVAAVVWETMITYNGVTRTAREWLGLAADTPGIASAVWSESLTLDGVPAFASVWTTEARKLAASCESKLDGLTVPGGDPDALRQIVREEVDAALAELRLGTIVPT